MVCRRPFFSNLTTEKSAVYGNGSSLLLIGVGFLLTRASNFLSLIATLEWNSDGILLFERKRFFPAFPVRNNPAACSTGFVECVDFCHILSGEMKRDCSWCETPTCEKTFGIEKPKYLYWQKPVNYSINNKTSFQSDRMNDATKNFFGWD